MSRETCRNLSIKLSTPKVVTRSYHDVPRLTMSVEVDIARPKSAAVPLPGCGISDHDL
jgi:hypothetical protein